MRLWRKLRGGTACVRVAPIRPVASASAPLRNDLIRCPPRASCCPCVRRHRAFERRLIVERTRDGIAAASGRRWITIGISGVALTRTRIMSTRHPYHLLTDSRARRSEAILWLAHHHTACPPQARTYLPRHQQESQFLCSGTKCPGVFPVHQWSLSGRPCVMRTPYRVDAQPSRPGSWSGAA